MDSTDPNPRDLDQELTVVEDSLAAEPPEDLEFHDHAQAEGEAWKRGDETDEGPAS